MQVYPIIKTSRQPSQFENHPHRSAGGVVSPPLQPASLGTITKSCNTPANHRLERWAMQSAAREILPSERVSSCLRTISKFKQPTPSTLQNFLSADYFQNVEILRTKDRFHYGNLTTCGSVWHCPICAAKISELRRAELTKAVENCKSNGGQVHLLTLTVPHYSHQKVKTVLRGLTDALRRLTNSRGWKSLSERIGLFGRIRSLEVTYGENGWHPHFHLLLFTHRPFNIAYLQAELLDLWKVACVRSSLPEPNQHGVKLDDGKLAAQYVGKWGIEHEMTYGHIKKSREGYSPFDLLRVQIGGALSDRCLDDKPEKAAELFREYAKAFKGKRQLVWSKDLRNMLLSDLPELTDEEAADSVDADAEFFALVPLTIWKIVLKKNLRGVVLEKCRAGLDVLGEYLQELSDKHLTKKGAICEEPLITQSLSTMTTDSLQSSFSLTTDPAKEN